MWVVYPTIHTIIRSFYDRSGDTFVWFDNYQTIFTSDILVTAVKNNLLWVLVVPAAVASIGLVFAVLMERVSWAVAFRTAVFMPMAISAFAAGITWRIVYLDDPNLGVANAAIKSVDDVFNPSGVLPQASPSTKDVVQQGGGGMQLKNPVQAGDTAELGLTAIPPTDIPSDAQQAVAPEPRQGGISGVVWRDFKPEAESRARLSPRSWGCPACTSTCSTRAARRSPPPPALPTAASSLPMWATARTRSRSAPRRSPSRSGASSGWARGW